MKQYKKNRYQEYLKQAIFSEKSNNLDFACVLYKECLKMNPGDKYLQQKILGFEKIKDCSQCVCPKPEYCLRYKSDMSNGLIDHNWCKNASTQEREIFLSYKNSLQKHTSLPDCGCIFANAHDIKHKEITLNTKSKGRVKVSRLKIFCVGHSQKQFETIEYKPYLETVNLNHLNVGKYSGNEWAEARGFLAYEDLVSDDMDFVGFVTASWNSKYTEPIHDFHKWDNVKILLNSKPEDKIFLCADLLCSCEWIKQQNILGAIYKNNPKQIVKSFLKLIGLKSNHHKYVPCSNQMISHKENIKEYVDFLISNEILDKISWYVEKLGNDNFVDSFTKYSYNQNRVKAYFTELVSFFWFANQDYTYLPTVKRLTDWYTAERIEKREKEWK